MLEQNWACIADVDRGFSEDEILAALTKYNVVAVKREYTRRYIDGKLSSFPTDRIQLKFSSVPVTEVYLGYKTHKVVLHAGTPVHCVKCQKLGHVSSVCRNESACKNCGRSGHLAAQCKNASRCVNCKGSHAASSPQCPLRACEIEKRKAWMEARLLQQIKADNPEASHVKVITVTNPDEGAINKKCGEPMDSKKVPAVSGTSARSYAAVVRSVVLDKPEGVQVMINLPGATNIPNITKKSKARGTRKTYKGYSLKGRLPKSSRASRVSTKISLNSLNPVLNLLTAVCPKAAKSLRKLILVLGPLLSVLDVKQ